MPDTIAARKRLLSDAPSPPSTYVDVVNMPWETSKFPGIEHKVLYTDQATGMSALLFRLAPGAVVPLHEHTGVELTYVLEGSLEDDEGACTTGNFVWRPAGNTHVARAPNGAVILGVFMRPNHFAEGQRFFTDTDSG
jgi:anti-sigma factor ChrR (cupin superfamily)